jgi:CubicO group peptidase (beta-lactamase class C family)
MPTQIDAAAVDQFLSRELTAASIPGAAVAITLGDQVLHVRGYGHDSHHVPVTDRTLFRIASLSKSFTSLAVLQLVDAGRVSLDDSVAEHLP